MEQQMLSPGKDAHAEQFVKNVLLENIKSTSFPRSDVELVVHGALNDATNGNTTDVVRVHSQVLAACSCLLHDILKDVLHQLATADCCRTPSLSLIIVDSGGGIDRHLSSRFASFLYRGSIVGARDECRQVTELLTAIGSTIHVSVSRLDEDAADDQRTDIDDVLATHTVDGPALKSEIGDERSCDGDAAVTPISDWRYFEGSHTIVKIESDNSSCCRNRKSKQTERIVMNNRSCITSDTAGVQQLKRHEDKEGITPFSEDDTENKAPTPSFIPPNSCERDLNNGRLVCTLCCSGDKSNNGRSIASVYFASELQLRRHVRDAHRRRCMRRRDERFRHRRRIVDGNGDDAERRLTVQNGNTKRQRRRRDVLQPRQKAHCCQLCPKRFPSAKILKDHINVHSGTKPYLCEQCSESFHYQHSLSMHLRKKHLTCSSVKDRKDGRDSGSIEQQPENIGDEKQRQSVVIVSSQEKFICQVCGKSFTQNGTLKIHSRLHTGEKPHECGYCEKRFNYRNALRSHMFLHTGEKPYRCQICNKGYVDSANLHRHRFTHNAVKQFACTLCAKAFHHKTLLAAHVRTHTGQQPFPCDRCTKRFASRRDLNRHRNTQCC